MVSETGTLLAVTQLKDSTGPQLKCSSRSKVEFVPSALLTLGGYTERDGASSRLRSSLECVPARVGMKTSFVLNFVRLVEGVLVGPGLSRVEKFGRNAFEGSRDREVEHWRLLELALGEGSIVDRVDELASDLEGASLSGSETSTYPTVKIEDRVSSCFDRCRKRVDALCLITKLACRNRFLICLLPIWSTSSRIAHREVLHTSSIRPDSIPG